VLSVAKIRTAAAAIPAVCGRAAVMAAPGQIELREIEFRELRVGEVRVRIEGCGVCASNLPLWEGKPWFEYPMEPGAPGHEAWGRIDATGAGTGDLAIALQCSHHTALRSMTSRPRLKSSDFPIL
jgi:NADPH:quinone reductase-like Zn-dependent oxidoreductase